LDEDSDCDSESEIGGERDLDGVVRQGGGASGASQPHQQGSGEELGQRHPHNSNVHR